MQSVLAALVSAQSGAPALPPAQQPTGHDTPTATAATATTAASSSSPFDTSPALPDVAAPVGQTGDAIPKYAPPSKLRSIVPWGIAAVFAAGAGVFYKLHADSEATRQQELKNYRSAIAGMEGQLHSREADIKQNVTLLDESNLREGAAVQQQIRAQRNLAKAQDTADFFFTAFLESGSRKPDTPERLAAFRRAEEFYVDALGDIGENPELLGRFGSGYSESGKNP